MFGSVAHKKHTGLAQGSSILAALMGLMLLSAPGQAQTIRLNSYDCGAAAVAGAPSRLISQVIEGQHHVWSESLAADRSVACVTKSRPSAQVLNRTDAEAFLTRSRDLVGTPAARNLSQSPDSAQNINPMATAGLGGAMLPAPDLSRGGDKSAIQAGTPDQRVRVTDTSPTPWNLVTYIESRWVGSGMRCSGILVSPHVVMTAGHCLHDRSRGGSATSVLVAPGQSQASAASAIVRPYGTRQGSEWTTSQAWTAVSGQTRYEPADYGQDIGTIRVAEAFTHTTTFIPVVIGDRSTTVNSAGFPLAVGGVDNPGAMFRDAGGETTASRTLRDRGVAEFGFDASPGNSGGPMWAFESSTNRRFLVGTVSYAGDGQRFAGGPWYSTANEQVVRAFADWQPGAPPPPPQTAVPQTGWWWASTEPGRGYSIEVNPATGRLFFAVFGYRDDGAAVWYSATLAPATVNGGAGFVGTLYEVRGGQALRGAVRTPTTVAIGTLQLSVTAADRVTLHWPAALGGAATNITRFPINGTGITAAATGVRGQSGWYADPASPGRGFFVEVQGDQALIALYAYREDGSPVWYSAAGQLTSNGQLITGTMQQVAGGPTFANPQKGPVTAQTVGAMSFQYLEGDAVQFSLQDTMVSRIERFRNF